MLTSYPKSMLHIIFTLVIPFLFVWCTLFEKKPDQAILNWKEAYNNANYEQAREYFEQALHSNKDKEAYYLLWKSYYQIWNIDAALLALDHALNLDGWYADALATKWMIQLELWNNWQALELLVKAEKHDKHNLDILSTKWYVHYKLWQYDLALTYFNNVLEKKSHHIHALANKAVTLADSWQIKASLQYFDQAIALENDNYILLYNKGTALSDLAYQEKVSWIDWYTWYAYQALEMFDQVKLLNPDYISTYIYEWITYYDLENYQQAKTLLEYGTQEQPLHTDARLYLGKTEQALWNDEVAIQYFQRLLELAPGHEEALYQLSQLTI